MDRGSRRVVVSASLNALASVLLVSAVPLVVGALLPTDEAALNRLVRWLVCFAIGALLGAAFFHSFPWLLPFSAGGFVYIAAADLIPQLREANGQAPSGTPLVAIPLGIALTSVPLLLRVH